MMIRFENTREETLKSRIFVVPIELVNAVRHQALLAVAAANLTSPR
jgi:hypothetical protein